MTIALGTASVFQLAEALQTKVAKEVAFMSPQLREELHQTVASILTTFRRLHNYCSPINQLPSEILGTIFQLVPEPRHSLNEYDGWSDHLLPPWDPFVDVLQGIRVTHVCRHWRDIALGLPLFWTSIRDFTDASCTATLIQRAGEAPLRVNVSERASDLMRHFIETSSSHLAALWWEGQCACSIRGLLTSAAPNLESLTLSGVRKKRVHENVECTEKLLLFNDDLPRLQRLSICGFSHLPNNQIDSLTQLHLSHLWYDGLTADIMSLLSRTPNLVDLVLTGLQDWPLPSARIPTVSLGQLRTLTLRAMTDYIVILLSYIFVNARTAMRMTHFEPPVADGVNYGFSRTLPIATTTSLGIVQDANKLTIITLGSESGARLDSHSGVNPAALLKLVRSELPAPQVRELWIIEKPNKSETNPVSGSATFIETLGMLPGLQQLLLSARALSNMLQALRGNVTIPCVLPRELYVILHEGFGAEDMADFVAMSPLLASGGVQNLVVGFLPSYDGPHYVPVSLFEVISSVQCISLDNMPVMDLPAACRTSPHLHWPPWVDVFSLS